MFDLMLILISLLLINLSKCSTNDEEGGSIELIILTDGVVYAAFSTFHGLDRT